MTSIVISQSWYFPWLGMFEQLAAADIYVHYNDVPFSKGSRTNRVQLKNSNGTEWMTIPLAAFALGTPINQINSSSNTDWRSKHIQQFERHYSESKFYDEAAEILFDHLHGVFDGVNSQVVGATRDNKYSEVNGANANHSDNANANVSGDTEADANRSGGEQIVRVLEPSFESICDLFKSIKCTKPFKRIEDLAIPGSNSQRVLDVVKTCGADTYITGHGALNYLDHEEFERQGVEVRYIDYSMTPYPQLHGDFTPYVSVLDAIANLGTAGLSEIVRPKTRNWREIVGVEARAGLLEVSKSR